MLYEMAEQKDDDEPPKRKPSKWRKICAEHLEEKETSIDLIFFMASLSTRCFELIKKIDELYKDGKIKDQRMTKQESLILNRRIPDCKSANYKSLRNLKEEEQFHLLQKVAALECSFEETAKAAKDMKEMRFVQECFQKKVGEDDWDTVKEKYPEYTTYGALKPFKGVKQLEKHPPESFIRFCLRAVKTENGDKNESTTDDDVNTSTCIAGNNVAIVKYDPDSCLI
ncbi:uncharacterized protein [Ptychodera flava]|uniref:uncharacterized protein n=1 Tax=Ptychodera flava TaxID=63121 RepID=UPI003969DE52